MVFTRRALIAAAILAVTVTACGKSAGAGKPSAPPLPVDVALAHRGDIATYLSLDGQIAPQQESVLSTPQSGTVASVFVTEGTRVHAGQLLAKIDDSSLRAQLAAAQGQLAQASANLQGQTLQNPITSTQVSSAVTTATQGLVAARNSLTSAQASETNAKLVNDQNQSLLKEGYVSQTAAEQSRSQFVAAQQATANARTQVLAAQAALATAKQNLGQTGVQTQTVAAAKGSLQSMQGQVKLLQTQIEQTNIIAPFEGVVTQRLLDPGAFAGPNAPIVRVSQVNTVYVNINVPDEDLAYIRRGTPVAFTSSSIPGRTFHGMVFDVNATPTTGTLSYRARVLQQNPDETLRGGMLVTAQVQKEKHVNAILVPRTAVFQSEAGSNVYTVVDLPAPPSGAPAAAAPPAGPAPAPGAPPPPVIKQAKLVAVEVGLQTDTVTEIRSAAITPGTTIITTRPDQLHDQSTIAMTSPHGAAH
jgi:multidrug efflux pump subunit AcrA (membrane-fusion protein)